MLQHPLQVIEGYMLGVKKNTKHIKELKILS